MEIDKKVMLIEEKLEGMGNEEVKKIEEIINEVEKEREVLMVEKNIKVVEEIEKNVKVMKRGEIIE